MVVSEEESVGGHYHTRAEVTEVDNGILEAAPVGVVQLLGSELQS